MPIKPDAVGAESEPFERSWDSTACLLYALGVGAGSEELAFTTENSQGVEQQAVPTMGLILVGGAESVLQQLGTFDWRGLFHGAESLSSTNPSRSPANSAASPGSPPSMTKAPPPS